MDDLERRIRERAYRIWQEEGCPEGRDEDHWHMARELIAIENNYALTLKPLKQTAAIGPTSEPVEPLIAVENDGEFPTLTDQGEEKAYPPPLTDALGARHSDQR
jgi:hypothetical protein